MPKRTRRESGEELETATEAKPPALTEENPYTKLTLPYRRYVEARLQGLTISAAGRAAGFSKGSQASRAENDPRVRAAFKWAIRETSQRAEDLTKSDVMTGMLQAVDAAANASELVMAWRELGKLIGAYEPERKILEIHDYSEQEIKTLSDEDLVKLSGREMREAIDAEFREIRQTVSTKSAEEDADIQ